MLTLVAILRIVRISHFVRTLQFVRNFLLISRQSYENDSFYCFRKAAARPSQVVRREYLRCLQGVQMFVRVYGGRTLWLLVHFQETAKTEEMTAGRRLLEIAQLQLQEEEEDEAVLVTALVRLRQKDKNRRRRRWWVRPWMQRRQFYGQYETLFSELDREFDHDYMG